MSRKSLIYLVPIIIISSCNLFQKKPDDIVKYEDFNDSTAVYDDWDERDYSETWTGDNELLFSNYKGSKNKDWDLVHTDLRLEFNFENRSAKGTARLTLKTHWLPMDSLVLDAKGMTIASVLQIDTFVKDEKNFKTEDIVGSEVKFNQTDSTKLVVYFPKTVGSGKTATIEIQYEAFPYQSNMNGSAAISGDRGLYFINHDGKDPLKPRQIWTQGETESSSHWFPTLDAPNQKTTVRIALLVPDTMVTLSNGHMVSSEPGYIKGTRLDVWEQKQPHAPYLTMIAIGNWAVVKDQWRGKEVNYLLEKNYEPFAKLIFGNTPAMMEFFSNYLGVDFAWDKYTQVVVREFVSGAMENTTATVHMEQLQHTAEEHADETYEDYISHELFHQWFGDLVTTESWSNITLNESFATYGEYLWREHFYGHDNAEGLLAGLREEYRQYGVSEGVHLVRYEYDNEGELFDQVSYQKGGCILHMLRYTVGDDAFRESLKRYLTQNRFKSAEVANLRMAFEEVTGKDLQWFFDQWYFDGDHPQLILGNRILDNGHFAVAVNQTQSHRNTYAFPVKIKYSVGGKIEEKSFFIGKRMQDCDLGISQEPDWFIFDSDNSLLCDEELETKDFSGIENQLKMLNNAWEFAGIGSKLRLLNLAQNMVADIEDKNTIAEIKPWISAIYLKAVQSQNDVQVERAIAFAGGNEQLELITPSADGETLDANLYAAAKNRKLKVETRKTALANLYYSGMNGKSLMRFTNDSSLAIATFAIGYIYDAAVWETYALDMGISSKRATIATAWARKLIINNKGDVGQTIKALVNNNAVTNAQFYSVLNAVFYYQPIPAQIQMAESVCAFIAENRNGLLPTFLYRLSEEVQDVQKEIGEMDDFDPQLMKDLGDKKAALESIIQKYQK